MFQVTLSFVCPTVKAQSEGRAGPKENGPVMSDASPAQPLPVPKTKRGERTRQKILDAAAREIGRKGFSEASISTITAEADVGQGTFYLYFRSKEDVLRELVLRMGRRLRRHLTLAVANAPNRLEAERRGMRAFLEFVRAHPDLYRVVAESQFVDQAVFRRYYEDFAAGYIKGLRAAEARGEIPKGDAEVRAWALMGISDMVGRRFALWDGKAPLKRVAEAAFALISEGLVPRRD
jgi:AcrR family transcriptional regulator